MRLAVSDAILARLAAVTGKPGYTRAPDKATPPYSVIGQIKEEPIGVKSAGGPRWMLVEVMPWATGASRQPIDDMIDVITTGLDGFRIEPAGLAPARLMLESGTSDELHEDGLTWSGSITFRLLAQAV